MKLNSSQFRVPEGGSVDLQKWRTSIEPFYSSKGEYKEMLAGHVERLADLQQRLYRANRFALLIIFQGMDTAGKDGAIKHVMSGVNPQGCQVFSFKQPGPEELQHDFLWRTTRNLPERGRIGIFNRSYYEEVTIARVHPEILRAEGIPEIGAAEDDVWKSRYRSIASLERHLHANGTRIVKIYLHLSKEEQRLRLLQRIDDAGKNWKFSSADIEERQFWKQYMAAYEGCIGATSTRHSPWHVVPADDKENARLIVSHVVLDALGELDLTYSQNSKERELELQSFRDRLEQEATAEP